VKRLEIVRLLLRQLGVEPLSFVKLTLSERPLRAPEHPRQVRLEVSRLLIEHQNLRQKKTTTPRPGPASDR
jgi:hypothetical protein